MSSASPFIELPDSRCQMSLIDGTVEWIDLTDLKWQLAVKNPAF